MRSIEALAIAKVISDKQLKEFRADLSAGKYAVDFLARISGGLNVGEDYDQNIVAKADPWKLLAVALSKLNGVTVESIVREAEVDALDTEDIERRAKTAIAAIKAGTVTVCRGKVTTTLDVVIVPSNNLSGIPLDTVK